TLGQPGRRRLRVRELVGRLRAGPHRQRGVHVQLARLADPGNELLDRDLAQDVARPLGLACVALNETTVRATHSRNRLTGREVDDFVHFHAVVRLTPPYDW